LDQFGCHFKYITTSPQNLTKIDSAVAALRIREKKGIRVGFFLFTDPSIYLLSIYPFFTTLKGHIFSAILTLNGSDDVFLQPLVRFGVMMR